jgi:hypothetical protein
MTVAAARTLALQDGTANEKLHTMKSEVEKHR